MKIRAFDIFDIDATPEEFVTLVKSLNKDEIRPMLLTEKGFRQVHPVDLMNREGKVVKTYPSVTQAAREAGFKHPCKISSAIRHKRTYGGYWYRYSEDGQAE